ncbi:hypothetical protein GVAV_000808 [Gurleya vavrai]
MSDNQDQDSNQSFKKTIVFLILIAAGFILVVIASVFIFKKMYKKGAGAEEGAGEEGAPAEEKEGKFKESSANLVSQRKEKVSSPLKENSVKREAASYVLSDKKENDLSFSGLSAAASKSKKSELKEVAGDAKTDLLVNMGNIQ